MRQSISSLSIDEHFCIKNSWYRAARLSERQALFQQQAMAPSLSPQLDETIAQIVQRWKEQRPFHEETYFAQRLALDGLTEETFKTVLAFPSDQLDESMPAWVTILHKAFQDEAAYEWLLPVTDDATGRRNRVLLAPLKPLLKVYIDHFQIGLQRLKQQYPVLTFDVETMLPLCFSHLSSRLLSKLLRTLVLEVNVARIEGRLQGETSEERFQYFLSLLGKPRQMLALLEEYAVLARQLVATLEQWVVVELELCERLCQDWALICATFPQARTAGSLIEIKGDQGDAHRGGRSVAILIWQSGLHLVYKPRSLAADLHFQKVLTWLNSRGFQPEFRPLLILDRGTYGWSEWVEARPCLSQEEVVRFYQRQGGYLALLYGLEAIDLHRENIIAMGEHPMLIDMEALLQPRIAPQHRRKQGYIAMHAMNHSVLRVGLLPQRSWSRDGSAGIDLSGLGAQGKQRSPLPIPKWTDIGTDQMYLGQEYAELSFEQHRPTLQGQVIDTLAYQNDVIAGFSRVYHLLMQHREELVQDILPGFANVEIRCVLRQTQVYTMLLVNSYHPDMLQDALERDRLFNRLWMSVEALPYLKQVIAHENADLHVGDVPVFTTTPSSCDIYASDGTCVPMFFEAPALEMVKQRLEAFSVQDLVRQSWIIQAAFTSMTMGTSMLDQHHLNLQSAYQPATSERLLTAARAVGDRLAQLALHQEDKVGWLGVAFVHEREWHLLPAGTDLYNGMPGIALFLAYLGKLSGDEQYTALAKLTLKTVRDHLNEQMSRSGPGLIGVFNGLGSYIYLLSQLGTLWQDQELYQEAEKIACLLPERIDQDMIFDIMGGSAGCIAALLSLYAVAPSDTIRTLALCCGDHLIAHARPQRQGSGWSMHEDTLPMAGLSHGSAGIAWSLVRLFEMSGEERFLRTAQAAIEYERSLFVPERGNWPDLRNEEHPSFMVAWCHGASGIALARLGSLGAIDDTVIRTEIATGLQTTLASGFSTNHSLCHGALGNLEALLMAAQCFPQSFYQQELERLVPMVLESIERQGWITGIPQGVETPGLMVGLAGIGYGLLRQAFPLSVPSVLLPEVPLLGR